MPGDESVMMALSDEVITIPVTSRVSIASGATAFPSRTPRETMRAAVRCAAPMPSPSRKMMLRARGADARPAHASTRSVTFARAPSAVDASMTSGPAVGTL